MKIKYLVISLMAFLPLFFSCSCKQNSSSDSNESAQLSSESASLDANQIFANSQQTGICKIEYAQGLVLAERDGVIYAKISDPQGESGAVYNYAFVKDDDASSSKQAISKDFTVIKVPVSKLICMTSLQLSSFIKLKAYDNICGLTSTKHLFNKEIKGQMRKGLIKKIGIEGNFDNETIMNLNPSLIMISPFKRGGFEALKETGIPLLVHLGYKEPTPLGQAEWIKLAGILTGREEEALNLFDQTAARYNSLKMRVDSLLADNQKHSLKRPKIMSGEMRGGNWYVPGGKSFLATLFTDAGADYFLTDSASGGVTLDFESVYEKGVNADYWRLLVSNQDEFSYATLKSQDKRYADFKSFKKRGVIYCNQQQTPFYESSPMEPEVVLADFVKVFYPQLLNNYQPVYYKLLK